MKTTYIVITPLKYTSRPLPFNRGRTISIR